MKASGDPSDATSENDCVNGTNNDLLHFSDLCLSWVVVLFGAVCLLTQGLEADWHGVCRETKEYSNDGIKCRHALSEC